MDKDIDTHITTVQLFAFYFLSLCPSAHVSARKSEPVSSKCAVLILRSLKTLNMGRWLPVAADKLQTAGAADEQ